MMLFTGCLLQFLEVFAPFAFFLLMSHHHELALQALIAYCGKEEAAAATGLYHIYAMKWNLISLAIQYRISVESLLPHNLRTRFGEKIEIPDTCEVLCHTRQDGTYNIVIQAMHGWSEIDYFYYTSICCVPSQANIAAKSTRLQFPPQKVSRRRDSRVQGCFVLQGELRKHLESSQGTLWNGN